VIDAAMTEGTALLATMIHGYRAMDRWSDDRGANLLDSGAPFYDVYRTADGQYMAVGSIEPKFYAALIAGLEIDTADFPHQHDRAAWPLMKARFAAIFVGRTRAHWEQVFEGRDACVTPVLSPDEAAAHPHARARGMFARPDDVLQPMPAPRFSRTPGAIANAPPVSDLALDSIDPAWGMHNGR
jgi:alpha-methylacyl-CoA racemase